MALNVSFPIALKALGISLLMDAQVRRLYWRLQQLDARNLLPLEAGRADSAQEQGNSTIAACQDDLNRVSSAGA